ncbi:MAG: TauD/TfdA family dioxygenase [Gemmatimonadota bacterium]|nr:TauD/TfdA family dioxygenase [Gemmatimonadota bacterium]MDE2955171.1 TauD/TfdA family dioxygenase [Gemmatimonadota bacterium]
MLNKQITDSRAWTAETIDAPSEWYYTLSERYLSALNSEVRKADAIFDLRVSDTIACAPCLQPVLDALQTGRGFAIIERLPVEYYTRDQARAAYWMIGQCLGVPFEQNIEGTLLYDVRDTGRDVKSGARFSVTNAESSFHTDGAFGTQVPEIVGLLCIKTARSGGRSQLISSYAVHNILHQQAPNVLNALYSSFYFDRRGQYLPGEAPVKKTPVFSWDKQTLMMRYLHYYIQMGHREAGVPLTSEQERALQTVEDILKRPEMRVEFDLAPGQMLFTNNNWILHNRTAFEDDEQKRHYVRLWLMQKDNVDGCTENRD